jgi:hypothetical protein
MALLRRFRGASGVMTVALFLINNEDADLGLPEANLALPVNL